MHKLIHSHKKISIKLIKLIKITSTEVLSGIGIYMEDSSNWKSSVHI